LNKGFFEADRLFAFGDILFFNSQKKYAKKAVPQVPGGLIFRKSRWGF
jgi:hypothetical protein